MDITYPSFLACVPEAGRGPRAVLIVRKAKGKAKAQLVDYSMEVQLGVPKPIYNQLFGSGH